MVPYRRSQSGLLKANGSRSGVRLVDVWSTLRYILRCLIHSLLIIWDLNPVSLLLKRWRQFHQLNTLMAINIRPRLIDLATDLFMSEERRRRMLIAWVKSILTWVGNDFLDFTVCWQDGIVLCALMEAIGPGACPRFNQLKPHHRVNNCRLGLQMVMMYLQLHKLPMSPEEMAIADDGTEVKICHLVQLLKWKYHKQGSKPVLQSLVTVEEPLSCNCQARGTGIRSGIVGRRAKFNILTESASRLDLEVEIRGPNNEYNKEIIVSVDTGRSSPYRNHPLTRAASITDEDGKLKVIEDGAGHSFLRQKSLEEDLGHLVIPFDYQCVGEGRFLVTYIPRNAGLHYITILSDGVHIKGSPFEVKVSDWVSSWNLVSKPRVVPLDKHKDAVTPPSGSTEKVKPKLSKVAQMSQQLTRIKRRILKKVVANNGEGGKCEVTSTLTRQKGEDSDQLNNDQEGSEYMDQSCIETHRTSFKNMLNKTQHSSSTFLNKRMESSEAIRPTKIKSWQMTRQITPEIVITEPIDDKPGDFFNDDHNVRDLSTNNLAGGWGEFPISEQAFMGHKNLNRQASSVSQVFTHSGVYTPGIHSSYDDVALEAGGIITENDLIVPEVEIFSCTSSGSRSPSRSPSPRICDIVEALLKDTTLEKLASVAIEEHDSVTLEKRVFVALEEHGHAPLEKGAQLNNTSFECINQQSSVVSERGEGPSTFNHNNCQTTSRNLVKPLLSSSQSLMPSSESLKNPSKAVLPSSKSLMPPAVLLSSFSFDEDSKSNCQEHPAQSVPLDVSISASVGSFLQSSFPGTTHAKEELTTREQTDRTECHKTERDENNVTKSNESVFSSLEESTLGSREGCSSSSISSCQLTVQQKPEADIEDNVGEVTVIKSDQDMNLIRHVSEKVKSVNREDINGYNSVDNIIITRSYNNRIRNTTKESAGKGLTSLHRVSPYLSVPLNRNSTTPAESITQSINSVTAATVLENFEKNSFVIRPERSRIEPTTFRTQGELLNPLAPYNLMGNTNINNGIKHEDTHEENQKLLLNYCDSSSTKTATMSANRDTSYEQTMNKSLTYPVRDATISGNDVEEVISIPSDSAISAEKHNKTLQDLSSTHSGKDGDNKIDNEDFNKNAYTVDILNSKDLGKSYFHFERGISSEDKNSNSLINSVLYPHQITEIESTKRENAKNYKEYFETSLQDKNCSTHNLTIWDIDKNKNETIKDFSKLHDTQNYPGHSQNGLEEDEILRIIIEPRGNHSTFDYVYKQTSSMSQPTTVESYEYFPHLDTDVFPEGISYKVGERTVCCITPMRTVEGVSPLSDSSNKSGESDWSDVFSTNQKSTKANSMYLSKGDWSPQFVNFDYNGGLMSRRSSTNRSGNYQTSAVRIDSKSPRNELKNSDPRNNENVQEMMSDHVHGHFYNGNNVHGESVTCEYHEDDVPNPMKSYLKTSLEDSQRFNCEKCNQNLISSDSSDIAGVPTLDGSNLYHRRKHKKTHENKGSSGIDECTIDSSKDNVSLLSNESRSNQVLHKLNDVCPSFYDVPKIDAFFSMLNLLSPRTSDREYYHSLSSNRSARDLKTNKALSVSNSNIKLSMNNPVMESSSYSEFPNKIEYFRERILTPTKYRKHVQDSESSENNRCCHERHHQHFQETVNKIRSSFCREHSKLYVNNDADNDYLPVFPDSDSTRFLLTPGDRLMTPTKFKHRQKNTETCYHKIHSHGRGLNISTATSRPGFNSLNDFDNNACSIAQNVKTSVEEPGTNSQKQDPYNSGTNRIYTGQLTSNKSRPSCEQDNYSKNNHYNGTYSSGTSCINNKCYLYKNHNNSEELEADSRSQLSSCECCSSYLNDISTRRKNKEIHFKEQVRDGTERLLNNSEEIDGYNASYRFDSTNYSDRRMSLILPKNEDLILQHRKMLSFKQNTNEHQLREFDMYQQQDDSVNKQKRGDITNEREIQCQQRQFGLYNKQDSIQKLQQRMFNGNESSIQHHQLHHDLSQSHDDVVLQQQRMSNVNKSSIRQQRHQFDLSQSHDDVVQQEQRMSKVNDSLIPHQLHQLYQPQNQQQQIQHHHQQQSDPDLLQDQHTEQLYEQLHELDNTTDEVIDTLNLKLRRQSTVETTDSGITADGSHYSSQTSHSNDTATSEIPVFDDSFYINLFSTLP